ncbi:MAG: PAS domain-containing protein [Phocaeicola sp.]
MQLILVTAIILIFLLLLKEKRKRVELQKELIEKQLIKQPTADLNNFFNNTSAGCAVCNSTGVITEVNSAYLELLGANREEEVVNQLNLFNDPCINPEFKEMIRKGVSVLGELKYEYKKINDSYMVSNRKGIHYYRFITNYTFTPDGEIEKIFLLLLENTDIHLSIETKQNV